MFSVDGEDVQWGCDLERVTDKIIQVPTPNLNPILNSRAPTLGEVRDEAIDALTQIEKAIEKDIEYFNTLGGLGIAMNKLAFIKQDLQKIKKGLERI